MPKPLRILCTGDVHIGRRPSGALDARDARRWSCAAMWGSLVEYAIAQRVDLFAVSGDIVDRENRFYEAYGPLERGLKRLAEAGIEIVAVSGNHDFDVLPRLADQFRDDGFHLVGRDGRWERLTIRREGRPVLHIDGWSFPAARVLQSPLCDYRPSELARNGDAGNAGNDGAGNNSGNSAGDRAVPILGLLHADLDQPQSCYGPVMLADLRRHGIALWLLGHIHKPFWRAREMGMPAVLYPGSPQAMDPGECGVHGPWMVEIETDGTTRATQIPLSKVRYDVLDIDLAAVEDESGFQAFVPKAWRARLDVMAGEGGAEEFVASRLRLIGRTKLHRQVNRCCGDLRELALEVGNFAARIEHFSIDTQPAIDLADLVRGNDLPAVLARTLIQLQDSLAASEHAAQQTAPEGSPPVETRPAEAKPIEAPPIKSRQVEARQGEAAANESLVREAAERCNDIYTSRAYLGIAADARPDAGAIRATLLRQGLLLLDTLLAQREEA